MPVAAGTRSGAAAGGTDWQPRARCRSPRGGAIALDLWSLALRACPPSPLPASQLQSRRLSGIRSLDSRLQDRGRRKTRAQGECTALSPWGARGLVWTGKVILATIRVPLLGVPGPFPEASREEKAGDSPAGCWRGLGLGAPGILGPRRLLHLLRTTPLQVSLPEYCCQPSRGQAGRRCRGCEPLCSVPIRANATRV